MSSMYLKLREDWKENFLLYAASSILVSTSLGGITVMSIFQNGSNFFQMIQLFLVIVVCNIVLASILTVQKPERVLKALIASLILCSVILTFNLLF